MKTAQNVFAHLSGQDDNLGDSALRVAYLDALRGPGRHVHVYLGAPTTDYAAAFRLTPDVTVYEHRADWMRVERTTRRPVHAFNAGEINPRPGVYPDPRRAAECARVLDADGALIMAGIGLKSAEDVSSVTFDAAMRDASVMSWRDRGSRDAAGFGDFVPDWAFALGTPAEMWAPREERGLLAVTMRFDRPWPSAAWLAEVCALANQTETRIITIAQVARDAPRAVRLAAALGGEYLVPPSMRHDDLEAYVRGVYRQAIAVVSDRAHGLIIGATEGAFPIGSATDPQKIARLLSAVDLGDLVGRQDELADFSVKFDAHITALAPRIVAARAAIGELEARIHAAIDAVG